MQGIAVRQRFIAIVIIQNFHIIKQAFYQFQDEFQLKGSKVTMVVVQVSIYLRLFGFFMLFHCQLHFSGGAFQCIEAW